MTSEGSDERNGARVKHDAVDQGMGLGNRVRQLSATAPRILPCNWYVCEIDSNLKSVSNLRESRRFLGLETFACDRP